jgi:hypothetical protein
VEVADRVTVDSRDWAETLRPGIDQFDLEAHVAKHLLFCNPEEHKRKAQAQVLNACQEMQMYRERQDYHALKACSVYVKWYPNSPEVSEIDAMIWKGCDAVSVDKSWGPGSANDSTEALCSLYAKAFPSSPRASSAADKNSKALSAEREYRPPPSAPVGPTCSDFPDLYSCMARLGGPYVASNPVHRAIVEQCTRLKQQCGWR